MGGKWELTFTTLVTLGGAAFASFPSSIPQVSRGVLALDTHPFSFIVRAVSYEYRRKKGNVYGTKTYDIFLFINGCVGCVLLGVAVSMFFFGGEFTVNRGNLPRRLRTRNLAMGSRPTVSKPSSTGRTLCWVLQSFSLQGRRLASI